MIDWTAIQTALKSWFEGATGLSADWNRESEAANVRFGARGFLDITSSSRIGRTELTYNYNNLADPGAEMEPKLVGQQQFTLTAIVKSRSQRPDGNARYYLEMLRNASRIPSLYKILKDANLSIASISGVIDLDTPYDNRLESRRSLDIVFNTVYCETIPSEATGYMDKTKISSTTNAEQDFNDEIFGNQS